MQQSNQSDHANLPPVQQVCCRICLDTQLEGTMVSPCQCKGSAQFVHEKCLMEWANKNNKPTLNQCTGALQLVCEICQHRIPLIKTEFEEKRTCSQVKEKIEQQKVKLTIEASGIVGLIACLIYMSLKLVDYTSNKVEPFFIYITIGVIIVLSLCIIGLTASFIYDLIMKSHDVFSLREDYMSYKSVLPDSAIQLHPHI